MSRFLITMVCLVCSLSLIALAQSEPRSDIPPSLQQNCILTPDGLIDTCPVYRQAMRTRNRTLAIQRNQSLLQSKSTLLGILDVQIANQKKEKLTIIKNIPQTDAVVMIDYEQYITRRFRDFLIKNDRVENPVQVFFAQTYYDADQSGIGIGSVTLYSTVPNQYDDKITAQFKIRNYTTQTIDQIEDIYCFATIAGQDYIFPLAIQTVFAKNSWTTLVVQIPTKTSPLLDGLGQKRMYCTLVYTQDGTEKYTNRWIIDFVLK